MFIIFGFYLCNVFNMTNQEVDSVKFLKSSKLNLDYLELRPCKPYNIPKQQKLSPAEMQMKMNLLMKPDVIVHNLRQKLNEI